VRLENLKLRHWRNLADVSVSLGPKATVFSGANGQGKSNLIEAAYVAVSFRSFRTSSSAELIQWGAPSAHIEAKLKLGVLDRTVRVEIAPGKKSTTLDGKGVRRDAASLAGAAMVVFGPDDLRLIKAPASERRRALDRCVFAVYRPYYREALDFERALKNRNGILRRGGYGRELLESHDETLAKVGARIVMRRRETAAALAQEFGPVFGEIHGEPAARLGYRSDPSVEGAADEAEVEKALRNGLERERANDERRGFTGFGPQTDDVEVFLGDHAAKAHGSQGQLRSLVLAWKIAELRVVSERNHETPVLLLDDVASELDRERRARLFESISAMACQTLITVTEPEHLPELPGREDWSVWQGTVKRTG
jgi:DNA replication and repair protein RecF